MDDKSLMEFPPSCCPLCNNIFDTTNHRPKILPCTHTLCKQCIQTRSTSTCLACPHCGYKVSHQEMMAITTNFAVLDLCADESPHPPESKSDLANPTSQADQMVSTQTICDSLYANFVEAKCASDEVHKYTCFLNVYIRYANRDTFQIHVTV